VSQAEARAMVQVVGLIRREFGTLTLVLGALLLAIVV
jgi:hypothetical protein